MSSEGTYYVPDSSPWPIVGSVSLFILFIGAANWLHHKWFGPYLFFMGALMVFFMMFGWFRDVIFESQKGLYDDQVDRSFRWGMAWFIFSEVFFFAVFFGALFYARFFSAPWLGGEGAGLLTNYLLWPDFQHIWPQLINPDNINFVGPLKVIETWHLPALNTLILLTSGATVTWAHWGLKKNNRKHLIVGLAITVLLGMLFLYFQAHEYAEAYSEYGLKLNSGIYGTTFFMLTGFHGAHVTMGTLMLFIILIRSIKGHFTPENHFAFEAVAWYWHFVDVVWLFLFIFVYWL